MNTTGPDEHGSAYIYFNEHTRIKRTIPITANLDVDKDGNILGVELLGIPDNMKFDD